VCVCVNTCLIFCDVLYSRSPAAVSPLCLATEGGVEKEGKEDGEVRRPGQDGDDDDEPEEEEDLELDDYENAGIPPEDFYQTTVSQRDTIWAGGIGGLQPSPLHAMGVSIRDTFPGKIGVFRGKKKEEQGLWLRARSSEGLHPRRCHAPPAASCGNWSR